MQYIQDTAFPRYTSVMPSSAVSRLVTALFGILLMLAGQVPIAAFNTQSSEMACCRKSHHTCCKKAHETSGPQLQASNCGSPGCGIQIGTVSIPFHVTIAPATPDHLTVAALCRSLSYEFQSYFVQFSLSRFQRPPPSFA
jgi:hypothetical protein